MAAAAAAAAAGPVAILQDATGIALHRGPGDMWMVPLAPELSCALLLAPQCADLRALDPRAPAALLDPVVLDTLRAEQPTATGPTAAGTSLLPFRTPSDHNCLCHGAAIGLWGCQDKDYTLRGAIANNMDGDGAAATFFREQWAAMMRERDVRDFGVEIERSGEEWAREWQEELRLAREKEQSLTEIHILVLAHVIRRPIIVYSARYCKDVDGEELAPVYFGGVYLPVLLPPEECASPHPALLAYSQSHFTALVPLEAEAAPPSAPLHDAEGDALPIHFVDPAVIPGHAEWRMLLRKYLKLEDGPPFSVRLGAPRCPLATALLGEAAPPPPPPPEPVPDRSLTPTFVLEAPSDPPAAGPDAIDAPPPSPLTTTSAASLGDSPSSCDLSRTPSAVPMPPAAPVAGEAPAAASPKESSGSPPPQELSSPVLGPQAPGPCSPKHSPSPRPALPLGDKDAEAPPGCRTPPTGPKAAVNRSRTPGTPTVRRTSTADATAAASMLASRRPSEIDAPRGCAVGPASPPGRRLSTAAMGGGNPPVNAGSPGKTAAFAFGLSPPRGAGAKVSPGTPVIPSAGGGNASPSGGRRPSGIFRPSTSYETLSGKRVPSPSRSMSIASIGSDPMSPLQPRARSPMAPIPSDDVLERISSTRRVTTTSLRSPSPAVDFSHLPSLGGPAARPPTPGAALT